MQTSATGGDAGSSGLKPDSHRSLTTARRLGPDKRVGEFAFVPIATHTIEDDGVWRGFVYDAATGRSDLVIMDAATLETIVTIRLPDRISLGSHGNRIPAAP